MLLSKIVNFCLIVSYLGILVMQNINLAVIIAFGPISIGLSIFHPFSDNWKAFFQIISLNYCGTQLLICP
jgi:hypothetical protein